MSRLLKFGRFTRVMLIIASLSVMWLSSCRSHRQEVRTVIVYDDSAIEDEELTESIDEDTEGNQQDTVSILLDEIESWVGSPYRYGGHSRLGTDCSGMVMEIFLSVYGVSLPHSSVDMYKCCDAVELEELQIGDLLFFTFAKSGKISHVGIYIGEGHFVHSTTRRGVMVDSMDDGYYRRGFVAAGRVRM